MTTSTANLGGGGPWSRPAWLGLRPETLLALVGIMALLLPLSLA